MLHLILSLGLFCAIAGTVPVFIASRLSSYPEGKKKVLAVGSPAPLPHRCPYVTQLFSPLFQNWGLICLTLQFLLLQQFTQQGGALSVAIGFLPAFSTDFLSFPKTA